MKVEIISLLIDMGLFVLIWIVQLVIYPGFCYCSEPDMKRWHKIYTTRITMIVLPLMLGQLVLYSYHAWFSPDALTLSRLALVLSTWVITFFLAVPLHHRIDTEADSAEARAKLVNVNWYRTLIWTLILGISLSMV